MEYTYLGDTGLEVPRHCLGCGAFNYSDVWEWAVNGRDESVEVIEHAFDAGINFIAIIRTCSVLISCQT